MLCATAHLLASQVIIFVDTEMLLFLWSVIHFFTSDSSLGHFAACVQKECYSFLASVILPLVFAKRVSFSRLEVDRNISRLFACSFTNLITFILNATLYENLFCLADIICTYLLTS